MLTKDQDFNRISVAIVGPFGPAQLTCMRSWRRQGIRVVFVHLTNQDLDAWFIYKLVDGYIRLAPEQFMKDAGGSLLCTYLKEQRVTGVAALSYSSISRLHALARSRDWPHDTSVWATPDKTLHFLESKCEQIALAKKCGLDVVSTAYLSTASDAALVPFEYPWAIRPDGPASVFPNFKVELINSLSQWQNICMRTKEVRKPIIVQPFIDGVNIVVHGARSIIRNQNILSAFEVPSMLDGVTLNLVPIEMPKNLLEACRQFVDHADIVGVYHFEFRRSFIDGRYYFLEINGRLGGTTGKVFRLKYDEPCLLALCFNGEKMENPILAMGFTASNRQAILKAVRLSLGDKLTVFDYPRQRLLKRLKILLIGAITWRDEILFWSEARSGLIFLLDSLRRKIG